MYKNLIVVGGGFAGTKVTQELEHTLPSRVPWAASTFGATRWGPLRPLSRASLTAGGTPAALCSRQGIGLVTASIHRYTGLSLV